MAADGSLSMNIDKRIVAFGAVCVALGAIWTFSDRVKTAIHTPYALASTLKSESMQRRDNDAVLDERSVNIGVDFYASQLREWLLKPPSTEDPIARRQYDEIIENKRRKLRVYEEKWLKIQQSK